MKTFTKPKNQTHTPALVLAAVFSVSISGPTTQATAAEPMGALKGLSITDAQAANKPPIISFKTSVNGATITFDATGSTDPDGTIQEYKWDFGDGSTGSGATTSHTFSADPTPVTLTAIDDKGGVAIAQTKVQGYTEAFEIIVDDADSTRFTTVGSWSFSTSSPGYYNNGYNTAPAGTGSSVATWSVDIPTGGKYEIYCYYTEYTNRATDSPFSVINNGNKVGFKAVNQQMNGQTFFSLGEYTLAQGKVQVTLANSGNGYSIADAIKVKYIQ